MNFTNIELLNADEWWQVYNTGFDNIEKYDPDGEINYQDYFANDACNYNDPDGGTGNWASEWLEANPDDELTAITQHCSSCAHSQSLNCVRKGIACWHLWTRLAGWSGIISKTYEHKQESIILYPNPADNYLYINDIKEGSRLLIKSMHGLTIIDIIADQKLMKMDIGSLKKGIYFVEIKNKNEAYLTNKFIKS